MILKSYWLMSRFIFNVFKSWYLLYSLKNEKNTNIIGIGGWRVMSGSNYSLLNLFPVYILGLAQIYITSMIILWPIKFVVAVVQI